VGSVIGRVWVGVYGYVFKYVVVSGRVRVCVVVVREYGVCECTCQCVAMG
jgi:hypothetical protein